MTRDALYEALQAITGGNFDELDLTREDGEVIIKFFDIVEPQYRTWGEVCEQLATWDESPKRSK